MRRLFQARQTGKNARIKKLAAPKADRPARIVDDIPDSGGPKENGCSRPGFCRTQESYAQEHEDCRSLTKHFESKKTLGEFTNGLCLAIELPRHADNIRQCPMITGQQSCGRS